MELQTCFRHTSVLNIKNTICISIHNGRLFSDFQCNRGVLPKYSGAEWIKNNTPMNLYLSDVILRPSCYNCQFKGIDRAADITLGDAWGINKILPIMDDDGGTS